MKTSGTQGARMSRPQGRHHKNHCSLGGLAHNLQNLGLDGEQVDAWPDPGASVLKGDCRHLKPRTQHYGARAPRPCQVLIQGALSPCTERGLYLHNDRMSSLLRRNQMLF